MPLKKENSLQIEYDTAAKTESKYGITKVGRTIGEKKQSSNRLSEEVINLPQQNITRRTKRFVNPKTVVMDDNIINSILEEEGISFSILDEEGISFAKYIKMQKGERRKPDTSLDLITFSDERLPQRTRRNHLKNKESGNEQTPETVINEEIIRNFRGKKQKSDNSTELFDVTEANLFEMETAKGARSKRRNIASKTVISNPDAEVKSLQKKLRRIVKKVGAIGSEGDNSFAISEGKQDIVPKITNTIQDIKPTSNRIPEEFLNLPQKRTLRTRRNMNIENVETEDNCTSKPKSNESAIVIKHARVQKDNKQNSGISSKLSQRTMRSNIKKQQIVESEYDNHTSETVCKDNVVPKVRTLRERKQISYKEQNNIIEDMAPQRKRKNMKNEVIKNEANLNSKKQNKDNVSVKINPKSKPDNKENVTLVRKTRKRKVKDSNTPKGKESRKQLDTPETSLPLAVGRSRRTAANALKS